MRIHPPPLGWLDSRKDLVGWQVPGVAEIGNDNTSAIVQASHEYVIRLEVAMNDVTVVQVLYTLQHLPDDDGSFDVVETPSLVLDI